MVSAGLLFLGVGLCIRCPAKCRSGALCARSGALWGCMSLNFDLGVSFILEDSNAGISALERYTITQLGSTSRNIITIPPDVET